MQALAGVATGLVIGRLFILGHDACHQSLTTHRTLNRWIGRIVFLPSLTPYSLWEVGHNVIHHGYTNLRGFDFVWQPRSLAEFQALSPARQWLERIYRSGWAPWLYYLVEIWWSRLLFPNRSNMPTRRAVFVWDGLLASTFAVAWIAALVVAARATGQSPAWLVAVGFALPFLFWNGLIGFVVYVHHTHTGVLWHQDKKSWSAAQPFVSTTVHLTFRSAFGSRAAPHHGAHRPSRGHEHPAVSTEGRAGLAGTAPGRPHRGAAVLLALVRATRRAAASSTTSTPAAGRTSPAGRVRPPGYCR
jgi:omega-6 fatty acid desaturase (delta-12 desaturase)